MGYRSVTLLVFALCLAQAQDPATLDKITSTINAKVTSAGVREYCICELQPDLWSNVNGQVLVDRNVTSDGANHVFRITDGLFYDEISSSRPSGLAESKRSGLVAIASADTAFQRGAPFFISDPSLDSSAKTLRYTLLSNPAIRLSGVFARYQSISSGFTFEVIGSNQPFSSSSSPQNLTWQFNAPITAGNKQERFSMVTYGAVSGPNVRCLQSNEIELTALLPPIITAVTNNASGQANISSGSWVSIYGNNLSSTTRGWQDSDFSGKNLPLALDGVSVKINGKSAAVNYVSPGQLNVQAPTDSATGSVQVEVKNSLGTVTGNATLATYAPGFYTFQAKYVAGVHADGVYVAPVGYFGSGVASRPAQPGETLSVYGTGFGPTTPSVPAGVIVGDAAPIADLSLLRITIGGVAASVQFAGIVAAGEYQFNVVIPALPDGEQTIVATIAGVSTQTGVSIAIKTAAAPACQSNCTITTSVGTFGVASAQLGDRFPPGCSPGPGCSVAQPGFQVLAVFLELQGALTGSVLGLSNPSAYVLAEDGSKTPVFSGGLLSGKYFIAFTPSAKVKKFVLYWPGNDPVDLAPLLP